MIAIKLENVSKKFRRYSQFKKPTTFKSALVDLIKGRSGSEDDQYLNALKNIDLEVAQGTTLGVIGKNGSGKSTLLKILAGIYRPNSGKVEVSGRVSALIELGAGFHPELSGKENIFINGMILGLSRKEIRQKFDEIVAFAELAEFIDAPVRTYSSGMYARLGFSVAVNVNPDILLVDEVLAVGDEGFQKRCLERINMFKSEKKTIVLVSHSMDMIKRVCEKAIFLDSGSMVEYGSADQVVESYLSDEISKDKIRLKALSQKEFPQHIKEGKTEPIKIVGIDIMDKTGMNKIILQNGEKMILRIKYSCTAKVYDPIFRVGIHRDDGIHMTGFVMKKGFIEFIDKEGFVDLEIENIWFNSGVYLVSIAVADGKTQHIYDRHLNAYRFRIINKEQEHGLVSQMHRWNVYGSNR